MKSTFHVRATPPVWRGLAVGIVLATVVVAALVVRATSALGEHPGEGERSASAHLVGLEMVRVQERALADAVETSLSLRPGAVVLLVVPLIGLGVGSRVRRHDASAPSSQLSSPLPTVCTTGVTSRGRTATMKNSTEARATPHDERNVDDAEGET